MNHIRAPRSRTTGFSLMELMIVVVITGVLAAIAIPTFGGYVQKSRTAEATQMLGLIKLKQEGYRAEFGNYFLCPNAAQDMSDFVYVPGDATVMKNAVAKPIPATDPCFSGLGVRPDGDVRFGYGWIAGPPPAPAGVTAALNLQAADQDHYFVAHATTDLDGDGTAVFFELSNFTRGVYIMYADGTPLAEGWE